MLLPIIVYSWLLAREDVQPYQVSTYSNRARNLLRHWDMVPMVLLRAD
jgi:hypothetical protein